MYFPNLAGLRFIAASLVIFHHVEQYKKWAGVENYFSNPIVANVGEVAVSFFFVLSGFLITYLLLVEEKKYGSISIKNFYARRILRIWPVYYLIVFFVLVALPFFLPLDEIFGSERLSNLDFTVSMLLLILPNMLRVTGDIIIGGNQLWSIGLEEQFYLIWPVLIVLFRKKVLHFLLGFLALKLLVALTIHYLSYQHPQSISLRQLSFLWGIFKIEQMTIGAVGAWIVYNKKSSILRIVYSEQVQWLTLVLIVVFLFKTKHFIAFTYLEAIAYGILILNLATNPKTLIKLNVPLFEYLGQISYGIYMYHTSCIAIVMSGLYYFDIQIGVWYNIIIYIFSILLTLAVSHYSYVYIERPILRLKKKLQRVNIGTSMDQKVSMKQVIKNP